MRKKVFVIGANKEKLKYAVSDAKKIRQAFLHQGYTTIPNEVSSFRSSDFLYALKEFVDELKEEDQLIFYFVGHSFLGNNNELYLAIESSNLNDSKTYIGIQEVLFIVQQCRANNKMIVLDSCRSAALLTAVKLNLRNINYAIVCASEAWKKVPELETEEIQGGVLSHFIYQALNGTIPNALNQKQQLTPSSLNGWLLLQNEALQDLDIPKLRVVNNLTTTFIIAAFDGSLSGSDGIVQRLQPSNGAIQHIESLSIRLEKAAKKSSLSTTIENRLLELQLKKLMRDQEQLMRSFEALCKDQEQSLTYYDKDKFQRLIDIKLAEISEVISKVKDMEKKLEQANL